MQEQKIIGDLQWDGLGRPRIYYAMFSIFCGLFLSVLDGTICNVALPSIAEELQISSADSIWIINSFQLAVIMTLLPFSALGELFGYKNIYQSGVLVFTAGSLFCALSGSLATLVVSRIFQGIGASMMMSVNPSLVKITYPKRHLNKGVAINATTVGLASVAGPSLAAAILSFTEWPWLFAINIPFGIATAILAHFFLPDNPTKVTGRKFSIREAVLNALTFGLLIGSMEAYSHGASGMTAIAGICLFAAVAYMYVRNQIKKEFPMLPFDLLRIPVFSLSVVTSIISFTAQMTAMVAMPFMIVHTFGMNAVETGLLMTSWPVVIIAVAPIAGYLINRIHPGYLGAAGLMVMSCGCFLLSFIPADASHADIAIRLMLCGLGFGFFQSPNNHMLLSSAPSHRAGSAGGMQATARLTGQTLGAASVALLFHFLGDSAPHAAMLSAGILTLLGAVSSISRTLLKPTHI